MAERHRSNDKSKDTDKVLGDQDKVSQQGRGGGELARKVGTRDERKRTEERPAGATRVTGADEREKGNKND